MIAWRSYRWRAFGYRWLVPVSSFCLLFSLGMFLLADKPEDALIAKREAWLKQQLAPLLSDDLDIFSKECLSHASLAVPGPSWDPPYVDKRLLRKKRIEVLRKRLSASQKDIRFTIYALKASRKWPEELFEDILRHVDAESQEVRHEAVSSLVPWYGYGLYKDDHVAVERQEWVARVLEVLLPKIEGKNGEEIFAATGRWGEFLSWFKLTKEEGERFKRIGKKYLGSKSWRARRAAASLLGGLDFAGCEQELLSALKKEDDARVAYAIFAEAGSHEKNVRKTVSWLVEGSLHPTELKGQKTMLELSGWGLGSGNERIVAALRVLSVARERAKTDPGVVARAVKFISSQLGKGDRIRRQVVEKVARRVAFSFGKKDADFWEKHNLDAKLCSVLVEVGDVARPVQAHPRR